jgi:hypothetical protein
MTHFDDLMPSIHATFNIAGLRLCLCTKTLLAKTLAVAAEPRYNVLQMQRKETGMKTASMPSLRVDPELRHDAESVLREGETLSSLMEQALRSCIQSRRAQEEFVNRGLVSRNEARKSGEYFAADDVLNEMEELLLQATTKTRK